MLIRTILVAAVVMLAPSGLLHGAPPALIRVSDGATEYIGRLESMSKDLCWLMSRDGRLHELRINQLKSFKKVGSRFEPYSESEIRSQLLAEFGRNYEVRGTRHFLVCAPRGRANHYAPIFEDVYGSFYREFTTRGLQIDDPECPLVAVVFPDYRSYAAYCKRDKALSSLSALGYYSPKTNRIAMYEGRRTASPGSSVAPPRGSSTRSAFYPDTDVLPIRNTYGHFHKVDGGLEDTLIHETMHQVAFNTGLHQRIGKTPLWTIEGLATTFEASGIRNRAPRHATASRINRERYVWFGNFRKSRRKPDSLASFISSDAAFRTGTLDAYSQAWALTFYLFETRTTAYGKYLKRMADRDPLKPYPAAERIADFKAEFGDDLERFEVDFLRYFDRMKAR